MKDNVTAKVVLSVLLVAIALLSFFVIAGMASSPERNQKTIDAIESKTDTVLKLTATSTLASAAVSAIPGDTATPIAEKLADFSEYFLFILCVLYSEKYLLTIIGAAAFKVLIPAACLVTVVGIFWNPGVMRKLGLKLAVFALAAFVTIPLSIRISDMIYDTYDESIQSTIEAAEAFTSETAALSEAKDDETLFSSILSRISETATGLADRAAQILNTFVEALAVMIVTSCVIPILVILFFFWLIKILTGVEIHAPLPHRHKP
ncbi:MAG: hypothetical protein K6C08_15670 [Oscillospiraceae bacterium]|nr:hypothetical protein [Oscillospiraceae bacterium]